ncbi:oxygen-evolving enhancer protein 3 [Volvox carteri f. nagariensis]|uniref:Oxygen-evolving enhancer protein 3 n=1 Tax=Volvox carteri f. nagariensis TaxID=3068 RepID=D8TLJ4_VOLCA|nr:oxygen-evolving enhancer protein 3 [Volvox carteri f. nagariensis]EFJ51745.1 oxygen-evolving enhancer protein 3 [Volvox carteri f. nagariensis]|eukprot:XP_002947155.1 oxygen-evolving enhancer protein 3 [Volvox carteri f. nagariensis]
MALAQKVASRPAVASRRGVVVVRASVESRRAVLGGLLASTVVALTSANKAQAAATPVDLFDDRKVRETGFDLIYEARDLDLPQSARDGLDQARGSIDATIKRVKESETRIDADLEGFIKKNYWTEAREQLRRQVGTLRFDLNTLASAKGVKAEKKKALELKKEFIQKVEDLDFALREKDETSALKKLEAAKSALDSVLAYVL